MSADDTFAIRLARPADADAITLIYNHYVLNSTATFQITPDTPSTRRTWLKKRPPQHPVFVVELKGSVVGWGALSPYSLREAWLHTVEDSIYLAPSAQGQGIGQQLLTRLLETARQHCHHAVVARIVSEQPASLTLHKKLGFIERGRLSEVGKKFGRWLDVVYLQKTLTTEN